MNKIVLASSSPRRYEILKLLVEDFIVDYSTIDETIDDSISAVNNVKEIARLKTISISQKYENDWVIGADTIVCLNNRIIGKPKDKIHARRILKELSGTTHEVITGVFMKRGNFEISFSATTLVSMNEITDIEIERYIETNEPLDKAGAYGIQGKGAVFVKEIKGDFYNVMGLPINQIYSVIKENQFV